VLAADLNLWAEFADPASRADAAKRLAHRCGASNMLLFVRDPEVGVFLPAPGFPQRLPDGRKWITFLGDLPIGRPVSTRLPDPFADEECSMLAIRVHEDVCFVLICAEDGRVVIDDVSDIASVLALGVKGEFAIRNAEAVASHAEASEAKARQLTVKLDETRRELQAANIELKLVNAELEERVRQRTAELTSAYSEMEGFTYSVAHDLRTPIRGIVGICHMVRADYSDALPPEGAKELSELSDLALRLSKLVDDLLAFARLGRGQIKNSNVDLSALGHDAVVEMSRRFGRSAEAVIEPDMSCKGDPTLLRIVIENLVDNSFKYSKPGEPLHIKFFRAGEKTFVFEDDGIGFEPIYGDRIFRLFERLHREDQIRGTGIGLANVKRIIERHGGTIEAKGEPGVGATFAFTLGR
jgi:signal transduction histidine kinase